MLVLPVYSPVHVAHQVALDYLSGGGAGWALGWAGNNITRRFRCPENVACGGFWRPSS